jgi:hypothetical protein
MAPEHVTKDETDVPIADLGVITVQSAQVLGVTVAVGPSVQDAVTAVQQKVDAILARLRKHDLNPA